MKVDQAKRLKEVEKENSRLRKLVDYRGRGADGKKDKSLKGNRRYKKQRSPPINLVGFSYGAF